MQKPQLSSFVFFLFSVLVHVVCLRLSCFSHRCSQFYSFKFDFFNFFFPSGCCNSKDFFIVILQWDAVVVDTSVSFTSSVNSRWPGLVLCFSLLRALCRHLTSAISLILRWCAPTIFWVVLIKRCRAFLSWAVPLYLSFPSLNSEDVSEGLIQIWEMNAGNGKLHAACVFFGGGRKNNY